MVELAELKRKVFDIIQQQLGPDAMPVLDDLALIGDARTLDSIKLVEVCLSLEDEALALGFEFDWTSDTTLSRRGMFRTAGALADEFIRQFQEQA